MADMQKEIAEAIKKSLPQHVGEMLSKELKEYAEMRTAYSRMEKALKVSNLALDASNESQRQDASIVADAKKVLDREATVTERELRMNEHDLTVKLEAANSITNHAHEFVGLVFKSPVYRKNIMSNIDTVFTKDGQMETRHTTPFEETKTEE